MLTLLCLSCTSGKEAAPTPAIPSSPATVEALAAYYGAYATDDGDTLVIARLGWFFDLRDGAYRTIYATAEPNRFTIGHRFAVPTPKFADLTFGTGTLKVNQRSARRVAYKQSEVTIHADGADLRGAVTDPASPGPHPGIVIVHGAERGQRYFYDIWVGVYTGLGLSVLTYDKRGGGESTGTIRVSFQPRTP